jgi:NAD(P)-dependent dehydrogenase (short-subunit alcohol dehydrogenase family)
VNTRLVLVTGGSGSIGAHCIVQLLAAGCRVRTTVRSATREADVRAMLGVAGRRAGRVAVVRGCRSGLGCGLG